jgi:hypothetical protein
VYYSFTSNAVADTLNFSVGRTQTFSDIAIDSFSSTVNCTNAALTFLGAVGSSVNIAWFRANVLNLSSTTININSTTSLGGFTSCQILGVSTLTASTLTLNLRGTTGPVNQVAFESYNGTIGTLTVGAVVDANLNAGNINALTVNGSAIYFGSGTTLGTVTVAAGAYLNHGMPLNVTGAVSIGNSGVMTSLSGIGDAVFSSTVTIGAGASFTLGAGNYTFNGAVTVNGTAALPSQFRSTIVIGKSATFNAPSTFSYTTVDPYQLLILNNTVGVTSGTFSSFTNISVRAALTLSVPVAGETVYFTCDYLDSTAAGTISITSVAGASIVVYATEADLAASFAISGGASGSTSLNFPGGLTTSGTFTNSVATSGFASLEFFGGVVTSNTFTISVAAAGVANFSSGAAVVTTSTFTVSCTGSGSATASFGDGSSFNSLSLTNTVLIAGSIIVNGGAGRSFVYNVTAACPVGATLNCSSLTVTTPTCTITGVVSRRVDMFGGAVSITGSTPTLSHVSFYGTTINNGLSAFTGTRLGTDGLSSGFIAQTPAQKFLVLGGATAQINTAVWSLTSGGATSVNNYPLPQDTVVVDVASGGGTLQFTGAIAYLGSISVTGGAAVTFPITVMLGNYIYQPASNGVIFEGLTVYASGISARTLTLDGSGTIIYNNFIVNLLVTDSLNFIGTNNAVLRDWSYVAFYSGNITLSPTVRLTGFSLNSTFATIPGGADALNIDGSTTISTINFSWGGATNVSTTNYTVSLYNNGTYTNNATNTARNGSVVANGALATISNNSTTATNPLVELRFQNTVPTNVTEIRLNGNTFVQTLSSGNSTASNTARLVGAAGRTITKTNGGNVGVTALQVTNVRASPANTFYAVAPNSSLVGDTAGWTLGTPPSTPSGGFLLF